MPRWVGLALALGAVPPARAQEPELANLVRPLAMSWELCKARAAEALRAEGYRGLLESGNGWIARARGTSVSITCVGRNRETVLVLVSAGGQLVREATRLYERIRADSAATTEPARVAPAASVPERSGWTANAAALTGRPGTRFNFWCPPNGAAHPVWGDREYRADSSVCTAAVHAGTLTLAAGGNAIVEIRAGQDSYPAMSRNGVTSLAGGRSASGFIIITP